MRSRVVHAAVAISLGTLPGGAAAQGVAELIRVPEAEEIRLARSAAPASVSAEATIWVWRDGQFEVAVEGTNGNACMVSRSRARSIEPICYDAEGARTILPVEQRRVVLRLQGLSPDAVDAEIQRLVEAGHLPLPSRPVLSYMMSAGQRLVADDGREVGAWRPHLMLYWPYLEAADVGLQGVGLPVFVAREGEPFAHLITVVPDFIEPATVAKR